MPNLIYPEEAWIITHAPKGTSIGYSFQSEKGLRNYIETQILFRGYCTLLLIKIDLWSRAGLPIDRSPLNMDEV